MASLIYPERSLVMVGGMPGSGKSYLLDRVEVRTQLGATILSADKLRGDVQEARGFPRDAFIEECVEEARQEFHEELEQAYSGSESIIVEAAFLSEKSRRELIDWCSVRDYHAHLILVCTDWWTASESNSARARAVEQPKMEAYWNDFQILHIQLGLGVIDAGLSSAYKFWRHADHIAHRPNEEITEIVFGV